MPASNKNRIKLNKKKNKRINATIDGMKPNPISLCDRPHCVAHLFGLAAQVVPCEHVIIVILVLPPTQYTTDIQLIDNNA